MSGKQRRGRPKIDSYGRQTTLIDASLVRNQPGFSINLGVSGISGQELDIEISPACGAVRIIARIETPLIIEKFLTTSMRKATQHKPPGCRRPGAIAGGLVRLTLATSGIIRNLKGSEPFTLSDA
jgi:hypothetical protein